MSSRLHSLTAPTQLSTKTGFGVPFIELYTKSEGSILSSRLHSPTAPSPLGTKTSPASQGP